MSDLELTMMRRVGELKAEVERLKKFNEEALAHIAKEERKSRERLDIEQAENARLKAEVEAQAKRWAESEDLISHYKEQRDEVINDCQCSRLKAEVEELKSQPDPLTAYLYADTLRRDDIKTLKEHIERLTKAGDAMALALNLNDDVFDNHEKKLAQSAWNAAKEGKRQP